MVRGQLPAAVLFVLEFDLVGKKLFGDLAFGLAWRRVGGGANDDDSVVPTGVLTGVKARGVDGEVLNVTKLLLPFKDGDLVLLKDGPPLVLIAVLGTVGSISSMTGFGTGQ